MNIIFIILAGVVGFVVGRMSVGKSGCRSSEALSEMRDEAKEALDERTEKRKEQILEMTRDFEVQDKIVESCDVKNKKKGVEREDVEKRLGVSKPTALKYLDELENEGKIKQIGRGNVAYYKLV